MYTAVLKCCKHVVSPLVFMYFRSPAVHIRPEVLRFTEHFVRSVPIFHIFTDIAVKAGCRHPAGSGPRPVHIVCSVLCEYKWIPDVNFCVFHDVLLLPAKPFSIFFSSYHKSPGKNIPSALLLFWHFGVFVIFTIFPLFSTHSLLIYKHSLTI